MPSVGRMALTLSNSTGLVVEKFDWVLFSGNRDVMAAGSASPDSTSGDFSLNITVPVGSGDTLVLTGNSTDGVRCSGESAPFNIGAGQLTQVDLKIVCGTPGQGTDTGEVRVSTTLVDGDHCPTLNAWSVTPLSAPANGGLIEVNILASDLDSGETMSYAWSADSGSFVSPSSAHTQFVCGASGAASLELAISDSHTPVRCTLQVTFPPVDCLRPQSP